MRDEAFDRKVLEALRWEAVTLATLCRRVHGLPLITIRRAQLLESLMRLVANQDALVFVDPDDHKLSFASAPVADRAKVLELVK